MDVETLQRFPWFQQLLADVLDELTELTRDQNSQHPALQRELEELREQQVGWSQSLGNPELSSALRREIEQQWAETDKRKLDIEQSLARQISHDELVESICCPKAIADRVNRLDEVLALKNATLGNLELSLHIDRIDCFEDGRVVMRTCRLGALADARLLLRADGEDAKCESSIGTQSARRPSTSRRRTKLRVGTLGVDRHEATAAAEMAADPHRFDGLDETWFWHDEFQIPRRKSWAEENALEVARCRIDERLTHAQLEKRFRTTTPTIRRALNYAAAADPAIAEQLSALPKRMPRARWHEDYAAEVLRKAEELTRISHRGEARRALPELWRAVFAGRRL